jgi:predicted transcriptional regulator
MMKDLAAVERCAARSVLRARAKGLDIRFILIGGDRSGKFVFMQAREPFPPARVITDVPRVEWYVYGKSSGSVIRTFLRTVSGEMRDLVWTGLRDEQLESTEVAVDESVPNVWRQS